MVAGREIKRQSVDREAFNPDIELPYNLKIQDFENAMHDIYDFFFEIDSYSVKKGWGRLEDIIQKQALSNFLSNMLNTSLANHSRELVVNALPNGHPDLIPKGEYPGNRIMNASSGVEVKATSNASGAVDMHGARAQDLCVFVYETEDDLDKPIEVREPLTFTAVFLGHVESEDYRRNERGELGTRTATLNATGLERFRQNWVYLTNEVRTKKKWCKEMGVKPLSLRA